MDCPKCAAPHPDDAACCSVCHEFFKPKKKAPAATQESAPLMTPRVEVQLQDWSYIGPMVSTPEALYFFVESSRRELAPLKRLWGTALGASAGLVGGAVVDSALDAVASRVGRPTAVTFGPVSDIPSIYVLCPVSVDRPTCKDYFVVRRDQAKAVSLPDKDYLVVEGDGFTLEAHGPLGGALLSGFLRRWGYAMDDCQASAKKRRWLRALGWLALAAGVAAGVGELLEFKSLAELPVVQAFLTGPEGRLSKAGQYLGVAVVTIGIGWLCVSAHNAE